MFRTISPTLAGLYPLAGCRAGGIGVRVDCGALGIRAAGGGGTTASTCDGDGGWLGGGGGAEDSDRDWVFWCCASISGVAVVSECSRYGSPWAPCIGRGHSNRGSAAPPSPSSTCAWAGSWKSTLSCFVIHLACSAPVEGCIWLAVVPCTGVPVSVGWDEDGWPGLPVSVVGVRGDRRVYVAVRAIAGAAVGSSGGGSVFVSLAETLLVVGAICSSCIVSSSSLGGPSMCVAGGLGIGGCVVVV